MKKKTRIEQRVEKRAHELADAFAEACESGSDDWVTYMEIAFHSQELVWALLQQQEDGRSNPNIRTICTRYFQLKSQRSPKIEREEILKRIAADFPGESVTSVDNIIKRAKYKSVRDGARASVAFGRMVSRQDPETGESIRTHEFWDGTVLPPGEGIQQALDNLRKLGRYPPKK